MLILQFQCNQTQTIKKNIKTWIAAASNPVINCEHYKTNIKNTIVKAELQFA